MISSSLLALLPLLPSISLAIQPAEIPYGGLAQGYLGGLSQPPNTDFLYVMIE